MANQWDEREARIKRVMRWVKAEMQKPIIERDRAALIKRVRAEWPGLQRDSKAAALIRDAERVLAGDVTLEGLRGGRPREFLRKVDINDIRALADALVTLEQDMSTRKGAYIHAGSELGALISSARVIVDTYLEPA